MSISNRLSTGSSTHHATQGRAGFSSIRQLNCNLPKSCGARQIDPRGTRSHIPNSSSPRASTSNEKIPTGRLILCNLSIRHVLFKQKRCVADAAVLCWLQNFRPVIRR